MMTKPTKEAFEALRETMTREELAFFYNVSVSQIKRWVTELKVTKKINHNGKANKKVKPKIPEPNYDSGLSLMEKCKLRLGDRLSERNGGYLLDNKPCSSDVIIKAAKLSRAK